VDWNRRFVAYQRDFRGDDDLIVVVKVPEGKGGRERAEALVRAAAGRLASERACIESVVWGFDEGSVRPAAMRVMPFGEFEARMKQIRGAAAVLAAPDLPTLLSGAADSRPSDPAERAAMGPAILGLVSAIVSEGAESRPDAPADPPSWRFLESED